MVNPLIPKENLMETYKVSELKEKFNIELTAEEIKEYKDTILSISEIEKIRTNQATVGELVKLKLDNFSHAKNDVGNLDNSITEKPEQAAKQAIDKAKAIIPEDMAKKAEAAVEAGSFGVKFMEATAAFEKSDNPIAKFFGWLMGIIGGWFGFKKASEVVADATATITPEEGVVIQNKVSDKLGENLFGDMKNPVLKGLLEKKVSEMKLTKEETEKLNKKMLVNKGKLSLADIKSELGEERYKQISGELKNDPEIIKALKDQYTNLFINKLNNDFGINLSGAKRTELIKLLNERFDSQKIDVLEMGEKLNTEEGLSLGDISINLFGSVFGATWFMMTLMGKRIISIDHFSLNIIENGGKLLLGFKGLGSIFGGQGVDINDILGNVSEMEDTEKMLLLGLLYRKGSTLFELLGFISNLALSAVTYTLSSGKYSMKVFGDIDSRIADFTKLEKAFGGTQGAQALESVKGNITKIKTSQNIIKIISESKGDVEMIKKGLKGVLSPENFAKIANAKDIESIKPHILDFAKISDDSTMGKKVVSYFTQGLDTRIIETNRNLVDISRHQYKILQGDWRMLRIGTKIGEYLAILKVGPNAEKLVLEAGKEGLTKLEALKRLSLEAPELARSLFRGAPEIAILGIAAGTAKEGQSKIGAVLETIPLLTRVFGPGIMISSVSGALKDGKIQWFNVAEAGLGATFLAMDLAAVAKIFGEHGASGKTVIELGKFVLKPITAPVDLAVKGVKTAQTIADIAKAKGSWKEAGKEVLEKVGTKVKNIKSAKVAGTVAISAAVGYGVYEIFDEDFDDKYANLIKAKVIDDKGTVLNEKGLKTEYDKFDLNDKKTLIEILFIANNPYIDTSKLSYELSENNELTIKTDDKTYKGYTKEMIVSPDLEARLNNLGVKTSFNPVENKKA